MEEHLLTGNGVFCRRGSSFATFLSRIGSDGKNEGKRFVARNFLLDEGTLEPRADSYSVCGATADHRDFGAWLDRHTDFLGLHVQLAQPAGGSPQSLSPDNPALCPQTFRHDEAFRTFGAVLPTLDLVRVVNAQRIARALGRSLSLTEEDLLLWAREVVERKDDSLAAWQRLDALLQMWSTTLDLRPVWAGFWEDQRELFGTIPADDRRGWANLLRDRLGLVHLSPGARGALPVFVFRYPVRAVPRRLRFEGRPLAVPTVLDGDFSEAFCPAPGDHPVGRTVNLSAELETPSREIVHPFFPYRAEHLFRVGSIDAPPRPLVEARAAHLLVLRGHCARPDYAAGTDGDLLRP